VLQRSGLELCRLIGSVDWSHAVWGQIEKIETETHGFNQHHSFGSAPVLPLSSAPTPGSHGRRPSNLGFPWPSGTSTSAATLHRRRQAPALVFSSLSPPFYGSTVAVTSWSTPWTTSAAETSTPSLPQLWHGACLGVA